MFLQIRKLAKTLALAQVLRSAENTQTKVRNQRKPAGRCATAGQTGTKLPRRIKVLNRRVLKNLSPILLFKTSQPVKLRFEKI